MVHYKSSSFFSRYFFCYYLFVLYLIVFCGVSLASAEGGIEIAKTYVLEGTVPSQSGDIVVFNREKQEFILASIPGDEGLFGIVVDEPLLVLEVGNGGVPIVRSGEALVNVTAINGAINAGDYVTSSSIPGKGKKADAGDTYIVGVALDSFSGESLEDPGDLLGSAGAVNASSIRVLLSIGTQEQAAIQLLDEGPKATGFTEATVLNIIQYFLAAFIAVGSIYIAFKNFGPNIKDGIVSIGRNPLAKSSIQAMVVLNVVLIALIGIGGLFIGLAILLLPI